MRRDKPTIWAWLALFFVFVACGVAGNLQRPGDEALDLMSSAERLRLTQEAVAAKEAADKAEFVRIAAEHRSR